MTDIIAPPFSVVVQEIDALGNTETQHGHLMALMRHRAMLAAAPQPPVVEQPQVEQEPVAYATHDAEGSPSMLFFDRREAEVYCSSGEEPTPLYTHPQPKREPLTDDDLCKVFPVIKTYTEANKALYKSIARAIERAHGIGGDA